MTLSPDVISNTTEILTSIFMLLLLFALRIIKNKSEVLIKKIDEKGKHDPEDMERRIRADVHIYNELYKLMFISNSSRAYILQFHNGSVFNTNNPIWKFSKTYEICNNGVSSEVESTQNILIANMTQLLSPLFNNDNNSIAGIKYINCPSCSSIVNNNFKVCRANADKISLYYISSYLLNRSIKECIYAPIFNNSNNIVGLICLDYCNEYQYDELNEASMIKELFKVSAKISEQI